MSKQRKLLSKKEDNCEECFKIICRGCQWEPDEREVKLIQQGLLTTCPKCGWKPGTVRRPFLSGE